MSRKTFALFILVVLAIGTPIAVSAATSFASALGGLQNTQAERNAAILGN